MLKGLFVVGTDTGSGKTVFSAALTAALKHQGLDTGYMKPVGSDGMEMHGHLVSPDAGFVARAAGLEDPWEMINPVCLPGAISPLAASESSGLPVDLERIEPTFAELSRKHDFVVVEGVGGLLAPLTRSALAVTLNEHIDLPVMVVGRPGLGTINHTLLTIEALNQRKIPVLGFCYVASQEEDDDPSRKTNARHTTLFTDAPFYGTLPFIPGLDPENPDPKKILKAGITLTALIDHLTQP